MAWIRETVAYLADQPQQIAKKKLETMFEAEQKGRAMGKEDAPDS